MLTRILCGLALVAGLAAPAGAEPVYTLLSGGESEGTTRFVEDLTYLWRGSNPDLGSALLGRIVSPGPARLQRLRRMQAHFVIVDGDTLARRKADYPDIVAVALLWPEALHVLARRGDAGALAALPGGDLLVADTAGYGQAALAGALTPSDPATRWLLLARGGLSAALQRKLLPLLLASGVAPLPEVEQAMREGSDLRIVSIARPLSEQMRGQVPWLSTLTLPANTYPGQPLAVETLAVSQVLVTRADAPAEWVRHALAALFRWQDRMAAASPRFAAMDRKANAAAVVWFPFHAAALKEFGLTPPPPAGQ
jgi:TRAP-type uncharacterized transport system substrate-binding protein